MSTLLVATEVDVPMANGAGSDMVDLGFFGIEVKRVERSCWGDFDNGKSF
jgi:hypothetical protein